MGIRIFSDFATSHQIGLVNQNENNGVTQTSERTDEYHVRFIAANDNLDTANGFDIMSIFRDVINEWYVADTSRKIKAVFKSRMEKGLRCSGSVCYSCRASKEEKGE